MKPRSSQDVAERAAKEAQDVFSAPAAASRCQALPAAAQKADLHGPLESISGRKFELENPDLESKQ